jgi:hypothetical protein
MKWEICGLSLEVLGELTFASALAKWRQVAGKCRFFGGSVWSEDS